MKEKREDQRALDIINAYRKTFNTTAGKTVLFDLMNKTGFFHNELISTDKLIYKEGQRSILTSISGILGTDAKSLLKIYTDQKKKEADYYNMDDEDHI